MVCQTPARLRLGPLTVYVASSDGCPDLASLVASLPSDQPVIWLDSARTHPITGRWSMLAYDPWLVCSARGDRVEVRTSHATQTMRAHPLEALRHILRQYAIPGPAGARLGAAAKAVGLMGFLSYELNRWIETLPPPRASGPLVPEMVWFGMQRVILVDHLEQRSWLLSVADPHSPQPVAQREALEALDRLTTRRAESDHGDGGVRLSTLQATCSQGEFETMVSRALEHIRAGDIFQANLSQRFTAALEGRQRPSALALYRMLRRINPSPFSCFLSWNDLAVVSCSPELLIRVQEGRIDTRPIARTRPGGATATEDALNSLELLLSEKERAEHLMLVDLERNDLGRVCEPGSVSVDELMTLEEYSHVIHIVSGISGRLRRRLDAVDVIRAVFPGGTITGCPKVRCMQIIRELEPVARGLYSGSLGVLGFDGSLDLNIAIRTIVIQNSRLSFHVGAGIVADSIPEREYEETLAKAGALAQTLRATAAPILTDAATG